MGRDIPHPPFGHLLPQGEKNEQACLLSVVESVSEFTFQPTVRSQAAMAPLLPLREKVAAKPTDEGYLAASRKGKIMRARTLRKTMTDPERKLWAILRSRRFSGYKFRRQVPVGPYVADFLCFESRVLIEADGSQHSENTRDEHRDGWFAARGFITLRFWNHEILTQTAMVTETIWARLQERLSAPSSVAASPRHLLPQGEKEDTPYFDNEVQS